MLSQNVSLEALLPFLNLGILLHVPKSKSVNPILKNSSMLPTRLSNSTMKSTQVLILRPWRWCLEKTFTARAFSMWESQALFIISTFVLSLKVLLLLMLHLSKPSLLNYSLENLVSTQLICLCQVKSPIVLW